LAKAQKIEPPRIFISHAWEDKTLVRMLEKALADAGAEVWVDHAGIRGGDNLPKRINDALAWCNALLLVWSKTAADSHWVELEWTNAISLRKLIIPCPLDGTPLPPILANTAYVDFSDEKKGMRELLQALRLAQTRAEEREADSELAGAIHARLSQASPAAIPKPPQDEPKAASLKGKPPVSKPRTSVPRTIGRRIRKALVARGTSSSALAIATASTLATPSTCVPCARDNRLFDSLSYLILLNSAGSSEKLYES
jgi:hypothetical protein